MLNRNALAVAINTDRYHCPVSSEEFAALMTPLCKQRSDVAVAVSGGADSMALLLLTAQWAKANNSNVTALSIDHGLRAESEAEVHQVAQWCKAHSIKHHILSWRPENLTSAVQEQARNARYELLASWCKTHHVHYLLTAHHRDDQTETLFFRLARGSGLDGLACIQPSVPLQHEVALLRPLLAIAKSRLVATLESIRQPWIEDPSNQKLDYTRNYIRSLLQRTSHYDALSERAYALTQFFLRLRTALDAGTSERLQQCTQFSGETCTIESQKFMALEPEYGLRVLVKIVMRMGKNPRKPRTEKTQRFYDQLIRDMQGGKSLRRTFAHCLFKISAKKGTVLVLFENRTDRFL